MKSRFLFMAFMIFLSGLMASAQTLQDLMPSVLTDSQIAKLKEGEFIGFNSEKGDSPRFMPKHQLSRFPETFRTGSRPGMFIETLVLLPWSGDRSGLPLRLYNELGAVSTQEGLEYISYNRGNKLYPLITKSWYVKSFREKTKKLPDPVVSVIPAEEIRTVYQKDTTFGSNYYRYVYRYENGAIGLEITNHSDMLVMGLVPVAKPEELFIHFFIMPVEEGILCHTVAFIRNPPKQEKVLGYDVNVIGSFDKRLRVVLGWYKKRLGIR
jgi:hypothetical protein